jgi:chromate transporter
MTAPSSPPGSNAAPVDRRSAFLFWLKLGLVSFGGPAGQIALMHRVLVDERRWISEGRFLHALNYCMVLPGPEAQQLATYLGWLMHRTLGGVVAGALFVLPSLVLMIGLSWIYLTWGHTPLVAGLFLGIKPAVTAIVIQAAWRLGTRTLKNPALIALALLAFVAIAIVRLPFPVVMISAALVGALGARVRPAWFAGGGHAAGKGTAKVAALIDDDTPPPAHARFSAGGLVRVAGAGLVLWLVTMAAIVALRGWDDTLSAMGLFFTKAALLTFGGAYAVLPYVVQAAVEQHAWVTPAQMIDGLALGETTPGPLIMVVSFVGYVAGHTQALLGGDARFLAGALAACVVTWFTFLPSFVFILAGGPLVESSRQGTRFAAPLRAITAAVVGVISSLGVFFAAHAFWPQGLAQRPDVGLIAIAAIGLAVLVRGKANVMTVIGASALAGLALSLLR